MSKMNRKAPPEPSFADEDVSVTSVIFGLVMIAAVIVAVAALMGGSISRVEGRLANTTDAAARTVGLAVSEVRVVGLDADPALRRDVRAAAMIEPGENMFRADPHAIRARVEATRKVVNVRVLRLWPDQLVIMADAAQPMALFHDGADWAVVDTLGRVMDGVDPRAHANLPKLAGSGAKYAGLELIVQLDAVPELSGRVRLAERVAERRWNLHMEFGQVAMMPRDVDLGAALDTLLALDSRAHILNMRAASLDLRVAGRVFITPDAPRTGGNA